jgi:hypothetical protein
MRARSAPYDRRLDFVLPSALAEAVVTAAQARMQSVNSWLRAACIQQLREQELRSGDNAISRLSSVGALPPSSSTGDRTEIR